ncbi:MAG: tetratricopeptide repeat protein [Aureispira sp.]|nr:tetratricopeptide repeat protein [Aureispira sp.]
MNKEQLLEQLQSALLAKKSFDLGDLVQKAQETYPNELFTQQYTGEYHLLRWTYADAETAFAKAVELAPDNIDFKLKLAFAKRKNNDKDGAKAIYDALEVEVPNNVQVLFELGQYHAEAWEHEKALPYFSKVIEQDSTHYEAYKLRARTLGNTNEREKALVDINIVVEACPDDIKAYQERISINQGLKNKEAVILDYQKMHELEPDTSVHPSNLGHYLIQAKDFKGAIAAYNQSIELDIAKGWTPGYGNRGKAYLKNANYTEAIDDLTTHLKKNKNDNSAYADLAEALSHTGDLDGAIDNLSKALENTSFQKWELHLKRGKLHLLKKDYDKAITDFEEVSKDRFAQKDGFYQLGIVYLAKEDLKAAYNAWKQAEDHHHSEANDRIQEHCSDIVEAAEKEQREAIIKQFEGALEQNKQSPFLKRLFGKIWGIDKEATISNNQQAFAQLPDSFREMMLSALEHISVTISERAFVFMNPARDDMQAYFRIEKEDADSLTIYGQPTNGKPAKTVDITLIDNQLTLEGINPGVKLYFKAIDPSNITPMDKEQFQNKMKKLAGEFMSDIFSNIADQFEQ